jgi:hypothetical protein
MEFPTEHTIPYARGYARKKGTHHAGKAKHVGSSRRERQPCQEHDFNRAGVPGWTYCRPHARGRGRKKGTISPYPRAAQVLRSHQNFAAANNTIFIHLVRRSCIRILQRRTPHFHPPNFETIVATQRRLWQLLWGQEGSASLTVSNKFWHLDTSSSKCLCYDVYASVIVSRGKIKIKVIIYSAIEARL